MEKRIDLEKRGRPADQITDLNLDNCRSTNIVGLSDEYKALESLSLINVGLTTLKGFPNLPNLKKLELSDNRISNGLNHLTTSPKLTYLNLSGNKIKDLETLKPLECFQNLSVLDLFNNAATSADDYREKMFAMLPSLKYLDGFDSKEVEASSSDGDDSDDDSDDVEDEEEYGEYDDEDEDEDEDKSEEEKSDEDNGGVSLSELYNENLEEDNFDWEEENEAEDDDDEVTDDNEKDDNEKDDDESVNQKEEETPDNSQSRGKKRKHDG